MRSEDFVVRRKRGNRKLVFNNRRLTDAERFDIAVRGIAGKRLTCGQLTGKVGAEA